MVHCFKLLFSNFQNHFRFLLKLVDKKTTSNQIKFLPSISQSTYDSTRGKLIFPIQKLRFLQTEQVLDKQEFIVGLYQTTIRRMQHHLFCGLRTPVIWKILLACVCSSLGKKGRNSSCPYRSKYKNISRPANSTALVRLKIEFMVKKHLHHAPHVDQTNIGMSHSISYWSYRATLSHFTI